MTQASFPIALHLAGKACLVVGSNQEAAQRAATLAEGGAQVLALALAPSAELAAAAAEHGFRLEMRAFVEADLDDKWLAVLTDRDIELGAVMAAAASARRVLFCATDQAQDNSYSHLALARAGLVVAAIGTEGRAPALGRRLREELTRVFSEAGLADFAATLAVLRERTPSAERRDVLGAAVSEVRFEGRLALPRP
jgi:siroheme synthase-like protein